MGKMNVLLISILPVVLTLGIMTFVIEQKTQTLIDLQSKHFKEAVRQITLSERPSLDEISKEYQEHVSEEINQVFSLIKWITFFSIAVVFSSGIISNIFQRSQTEQKLKALTRRTLDFQEDERARVSRELHDGISQILVSVKYSIELASDKMSSNISDAIVQIQKAVNGLNEAISEVRRISRDLRPTVLDDLGLSEALDTLCQDFEERTGVEVSFMPASSVDVLSRNIQTDLYRIVQEAFTNIEKHSGASVVTILLENTSAAFFMRIEDNGCGFQMPKFRPFNKGDEGLGLKNMLERVVYHDGEITFNKGKLQGTLIEIKLPLTVEKVA